MMINLLVENREDSEPFEDAETNEETAMSLWQIVLGVFLILFALSLLGLAMPNLVLGIVALIAGIAVFAGR